MKKKKSPKKWRNRDIIPLSKRPWFFDKNGNIKYRVVYPSTANGKVIKKEHKTVCGGLINYLKLKT